MIRLIALSVYNAKIVSNISYVTPDDVTGITSGTPLVTSSLGGEISLKNARLHIEIIKPSCPLAGRLRNAALRVIDGPL